MATCKWNSEIKPEGSTLDQPMLFVCCCDQYKSMRFVRRSIWLPSRVVKILAPPLSSPKPSASQEKLSEHAKQRALQGNPQPPAWNENWDLPRTPPPISENWDLPRPPSPISDVPLPPSWPDIPRPPGGYNRPSWVHDLPRLPGTGPDNDFHPPSDPRGPIIYP